MAAEYRLPAPKIPLNWVYFLLSTHHRQLPYTPVELTATCLQVLYKVINNFVLLHSKEWVLGKFCLLLLTCLFIAIWDCILEITVIREGAILPNQHRFTIYRFAAQCRPLVLSFSYHSYHWNSQNKNNQERLQNEVQFYFTFCNKIGSPLSSGIQLYIAGGSISD